MPASLLIPNDLAVATGHLDRFFSCLVRLSAGDCAWARETPVPINRRAAAEVEERLARSEKPKIDPHPERGLFDYVACRRKALAA